MTANAGEIQRLIECCICCDYLTDVRETPCCHQLFCSNCIQAWLKRSNQTCPKCRSSNLLEQNLLKNVVIQRFVDHLQFDCPNVLHGCSAKMSKCDLEKHKRLCAQTPEKLAQKQRSKLEESRAWLTKHKTGQMKLTDKILYDLAKLFYTEHEHQLAYECLQLIKERICSYECLLLQGQIQRDVNQDDQAIESFAQALKATKSTSQRIDLLTINGHLLIRKAQYEQANAVFQQALDLLESRADAQQKAEILNALGLIAKKCSNYDRAITTYSEALRVVDVNSKLWSDIVSNLADIHRKKGNYNQARDLYLQSLKQIESIHGQNHPSAAEVLNNLAVLYKKQGFYTEALEYLKQTLKIVKHYSGSEHRDVGIYLTNVGDIYRKLGDFKTAEATYQEALTCLERAYGPNHIEVADLLNSMGLVLKKRADYDGAEEYYRRAIDIAHRTFGYDQEHYKLGIYYNNLGDLERKRNHFDQALEIYQRALTSIEKTLGPEHSEAADILHNIGQVHHQLGDYKQAIVYTNRALIIIKKEFNDKHYKYGMFLNSLGLAYAMISDYKMTYIYVKQALQILLRTLGANHIEVCDVYMNLGDICMKLAIEMEEKQEKSLQDKQGKLEEAKKNYLEAQKIVQQTFGNEHTKAIQLLSLLYIIDNYDVLCEISKGKKNIV